MPPPLLGRARRLFAHGGCRKRDPRSALAYLRRSCRIRRAPPGVTTDLSDDMFLESSNVVEHEIDSSQHVSQQMHDVVGRVNLLSVNIKALL